MRRLSLEVPTAYGLDLHDGNLAVACVDSFVRLFSAADLQYIVTLPRPPPLGSANIASIRELQDITDSAAKADTTGEVQPAVEALADKPVERVSCLGLRYPAALGCRIGPSGNKVVCIYADRGVFIWDISDPLCVGKYRSFLAHGACIWDIQRMPCEMMPGRGADRWAIVSYIFVGNIYPTLLARCLTASPLFGSNQSGVADVPHPRNGGQ